MSAEYKIRQAMTSDAMAVLKCRAEAIYSKAAGHYTEEEIRTWADEITEKKLRLCEEFINNPDVIFLVCEEEESKK